MILVGVCYRLAMPRCSVPGCDNDSRKEVCKNLSWYVFPLGDRRLLAAWIGRIRRKDFSPTKNHRICSAHFEESCYQLDLQAQFAAVGEIGGYKRRRPRHLTPGSVPSLLLGSAAASARGTAASASASSDSTSTGRRPSAYFKKRERDEVSPSL